MPLDRRQFMPVVDLAATFGYSAVRAMQNGLVKMRPFELVKIRCSDRLDAVFFGKIGERREVIIFFCLGFSV